MTVRSSSRRKPVPEPAVEAKREESEDSSSDSSSDEEDAKAITLRKTKKGIIPLEQSETGPSTRTRKNDSIVYIGHLPRELEEYDLRQLLQQFGKVLRLRVVRSNKTGGSRGYAFCQFATPKVAAIVADTLQGYILMGQKRLVCHVLPAEQVHETLFWASGKSKQAKKQHRSSAPLAKMKAITTRLVDRERKRRATLEKMGYTDFPGYEAAVQKDEEKVEASAEKSKQKRKRDKETPSTASSKKKSGKKKDCKDSVDSSASAKSTESASKKSKKEGRKGARKSDA